MARHLSAPALGTYPTREESAPAEHGAARTTLTGRDLRPVGRADASVEGTLGAGSASELARIGDKPSQPIGARTAAERVARRAPKQVRFVD